MSNNTILFYRIWDKVNKCYYPYYEFSNFSRFPFTDNNQVYYRTSEHYYQSKKATNVDDELLILNAETPKLAAELGRTLPVIKPNWEEIKTNIMYDALYYKFTTYPNLTSLLINTGDRKIIEDSPDSEWGWGNDHNGKNLLGVLLMKLREELRRK